MNRAFVARAMFVFMSFTATERDTCCLSINCYVADYNRLIRKNSQGYQPIGAKATNIQFYSQLS